MSRSLAHAIPYPHAAAAAHYESGLLRKRKGEVHQAREQLQGALTIFRRLGAQPYVERTEQVLAVPDRSAGPAR